MKHPRDYQATVLQKLADQASAALGLHKPDTLRVWPSSGLLTISIGPRLLLPHLGYDACQCYLHGMIYAAELLDHR